MDELNRHETMTTLLSLMHHMRNKKIYNPPTSPLTPPSTGSSGAASTTGTPGLSQSTPVALPSWMVYLQKKMSSRSTHLNIKLFIAKLIINEPKVCIFISGVDSSCNSAIHFLFTPKFMIYGNVIYKRTGK